MLTFVNKIGKKVMEINDNGNMEILNEELKKTFIDKEEKEEKEDGK